MSVPRALRPFAHHNYRVLIAALAISIFGTGMWAVAMVYQVIHLGGYWYSAQPSEERPCPCRAPCAPLHTTTTAC